MILCTPSRYVLPPPDLTSPDAPPVFDPRHAGTELTESDFRKVDGRLLEHGIVFLHLESVAGMSTDDLLTLADHVGRISEEHFQDAWEAGIFKSGRD
jgi:hypothetical protein